MLKVYLDLARSGRVMAHLLDPPGLGVRFETREAMERGLAAAIDEHLAWLRSHGEPSLPEGGAFLVEEEVEVEGDFESGDDVGFYTPDAEPVTPEEVERYLRIASWAHEDLALLVRPLSNDLLDWRVNERRRSIRGSLLHIAQAELWYMTRIMDDPTVEGIPEAIAHVRKRLNEKPDAVLDGLQAAWDAFQRFARGLPPQWRERIVTPSWYASIPERWTARKMLRRCIEHCREHTKGIEYILSAKDGLGSTAVP